MGQSARLRCLCESEKPWLSNGMLFVTVRSLLTEIFVIMSNMSILTLRGVSRGGGSGPRPPPFFPLSSPCSAPFHTKRYTISIENFKGYRMRPLPRRSDASPRSYSRFSPLLVRRPLGPPRRPLLAILTTEMDSTASITPSQPL